MQIAELVPEIAQEIELAPELLLLAHLNKKLREFFRESRCWTQELPAITPGASPEITLSAPAGASIIGIKSIRRESDGKELLSTKESAMNAVSTTWRVEKADAPTRFIPSFDPRLLRLYPAPGPSPEPVVVKAVLSHSGDEVPDWMADFRDGIVAGTVASLQRIPSRPWSSPKDAKGGEVLFMDAIDRARIRARREGARGVERASFTSFEEL